ncbi:MAG: DUF2911 domain-containing protein [Saprospiraceae bacterium]|nr:DUF2911 domain-containing protein [Saprospiraceae bacterium]
MKKLLIVNLLCLIAFMANAQNTPKTSTPKSPEAAFTQQFGGSEIQVAYARPSARGRKIFGALVPFDALWRTGANDCTQIKLKEEVAIGGKMIAAGKYSLFSIPGADMWTIILNSETSGHGTSAYKEENDVHRFKVKSEKTDRFYETFTIEINDFDAKGDASLNLIWENTMVRIPLKNEMDAAVATTDAKPKMDAHAGHDMSKMNKMEGEKTANVKPKMEAMAGHDMSKMDKMDNGLKVQFAPVLSAYYGLKDALTADNSKLAAENGKAMKTALRKIDTKTWTAKERNAYDEVAKKLDTDAEHIGDNAGKIDHQREHFVSLSNNLTTLTKALKINSEPAYLQFCPMANGGKGAYWLSKENKVKNPYYGKSMLTCGSVKETL